MTISYKVFMEDITKNEHNKEWCTSKFKGHHRSRYLAVHRGDIVLVDFGKGNGLVHGSHPAYVLSKGSYITRNNKLWVIPIYWNPSRSKGAVDVEIHQKDCSGLKRSGYIPVNCLQFVNFRQVKKRIGITRNTGIQKEIENILFEQVGDEDDGDV